MIFLFRLIILLVFVCQHTLIFSQENKRLDGQVLDSAKNVVEGARVQLIDKKDTLRTRSDSKGRFSFGKLKSEQAALRISSVGYHDYNAHVDLSEIINRLEVVLATKSIELDEVVVKAKPNPIKVMQDTVEYNAAAFDVFEGDNLADLIKQFPGIEVDEQYNVKTNGEAVVKLRVNGEDFFTSNVSEFLAKLPAEIVSKIQVIDDYGDQANFTGIKTGEPTKMINVVTKEGMNRGRFGSASGNTATNNKVQTTANVNLWNGRKQTSMGLNLSTENNGAGHSQNYGGSFTRSNKFGKKGRYSVAYNTNIQEAAFANERHVETVSSIGTYYNNTNNQGEQGGNNHTANISLNNSTDLWFYNIRVSAGLGRSDNISLSDNDQYGAIKQRFKNNVESKSDNPNVQIGLDITRKLRQGKNQLSGTFNFSNSRQNSLQSILTNTLYYDQDDGSLSKDSVLNRVLDNQGMSQQFSFTTNYSFALGQTSDKDQGRKSLNISYRFSFRNSENTSSTAVLNETSNTYLLVDSLSSALKSLMIDQAIGLNFHYNKNKTRLTLGMNVRPVSLRSEFENFNRVIHNASLNYSPTLNFNKMLAKGKTISINYSGNNNAPSSLQLQPVRHTQNLQNITIGNPDLKSYFQHRLSSNFNVVQEKSGISLLLAANIATTQDEIVNNVIILPDTLGSYKRETRFVNTNGTYNTGSNYSLNIPVKGKPYSFNYGGSIGFSKKALFINSERYFNGGMNFSQHLNTNLNYKKISFTARLAYNQVNNNNIVGMNETPEIDGMDPVFNIGQYTTTNFFVTKTFSTNLSGRLRLKTLHLSWMSNYSYSRNQSPSLAQSQRNLTTLNLSLNGQYTLLKSYRIDFSSSKRLNTGYALANQNPLLIGVGASKMMLKNKALHLTVRANDLLNQGNMLSRRVAGNSIIDSRSNVVTQVFSLGLRYSLSAFGAKNVHIQVDPDE